MTVKATTGKLKCVLLDANIVIEAYGLGVWERLVESVEIIVPSIVARDEALFYEKGEIPYPIQLPRLISEGRITEVAATPEEMAVVESQFDSVFIHGIDDGELEALALLMAGRVGDTQFCTGDAPAIRALAMIGYSESGISMEELLKKSGLLLSLKKQFTQQFFRQVLSEGKVNRLTGRGLTGGKGQF